MISYLKFNALLSPYNAFHSIFLNKRITTLDRPQKKSQPRVHVRDLFGKSEPWVYASKLTLMTCTNASRTSKNLIGRSWYQYGV